MNAYRQVPFPTAPFCKTVKEEDLTLIWKDGSGNPVLIGSAMYWDYPDIFLPAPGVLNDFPKIVTRVCEGKGGEYCAPLRAGLSGVGWVVETSLEKCHECVDALVVEPPRWPKQPLKVCGGNNCDRRTKLVDYLLLCWQFLLRLDGWNLHLLNWRVVVEDRHLG